MRSERWVCLGWMVSAACAPAAPGAATQTGAGPAQDVQDVRAGQAGQAGAGTATAVTPAGTAPQAGLATPEQSLPQAEGGAATAGAAGAAAAELPPTAADAGSGGMMSGRPLTTSPSACPPPPAGASAAEIDALNVVNTLRQAAGADCVSLDLNISQAANAHCAYYAWNKELDPTCTVNPHYEVEGCAGFTGVTPTDRMRAAGVMSSIGGGEVMAFLNDPLGAIQMWIDSVWHRIPILDPATMVIGYGTAEGCDTIDFGPGRRASATSVVVYPYNGQVDVTTTFDGRYEGPTPPAPATDWPSSNPISLYAQQVTVTEHQLFVDGDPTPLEHVWLDPLAPTLSADQHQLLRNVVFMYANQPFLPNTTYRVKIAGTYAGGPLAKEWTFTTGAGPQRRKRP